MTLYDFNSSQSAHNCVHITRVNHHNDIMMSAMASQITSPTIVYLTVCSGLDQRKYQSSASLAFVRGIHRWPVNSTHKGPVTRKMFPFDAVIMMSRSSKFKAPGLHSRHMMSSNGNISRVQVAGPLCGEFTGHRWIPCTKASDADLWCFLSSVPE